ncbi:hypothetical protein [Marivita sp.]|jgi:Flp pilus assembly pilin Flp|uniref:hypothetical protein n=1 Tax=Marivita sp. TaxID=2003365 RepID=UPI003F6BDCDC
MSENVELYPDQIPLEGRAKAGSMESSMIEFINRFQSDESGAVTVDWVVLTAAVVGMAMLTYVGLADNTQAVTDATGAAVLTAQDFLTN